LNDLGNLFLTLIILWAYMSFAQWLIIWMGNIDHETTWYVARGLSGDPDHRNGFRILGLVLVILHFFFPFLLLLSRDVKRRIETLTALAAFALILRAIDAYWMVVPSSLRPAGAQGLRVSWMDVLMPVGLFAIWFFAFITVLAARPLLARPQEEPEIEHDHGFEPVKHGHPGDYRSAAGID